MVSHGKAFSHCFGCDFPQQPLSFCGCISPIVSCSCKVFVFVFVFAIVFVLEFVFALVTTSKAGQPDLLYLENAIVRENAPCMSLVSVLPVIRNMLLNIDCCKVVHDQWYIQIVHATAK